MSAARSVVDLDRLALSCARDLAARQPQNNATIDQLASGGVPLGTDEFPIFRQQQTYKVTLAALATLLTPTALPTYGIINVQNYFVVGDVDYTPAWGRAIAYGQSLNRAFAVFAPDYYYVMGTGNPTPLPILSNMAIVGESQVGTVLSSQRTDGQPLFTSVSTSVDNFSLSTLSCEGNQNFTGFFTLRSGTVGPIYTNIYCSNVTFRNIGTPGNTNLGNGLGAHAFQVSPFNGPTFGSGGRNLQITNVTMHDCHCYEYEPITWGAIDGVIFVNNYIYNNNTTKPSIGFQTAAVSNYIYNQSVVIANNTFENNGYDLIIFGSQNVLVSNNNFNNNQNYSACYPQASTRVVNCQFITFSPTNTWTITGPNNTGNAITMYDYSGEWDDNPNIIPNSNNITIDGLVQGNYYAAIVLPSNTTTGTNASQSWITIRGRYTGFVANAILINASNQGAGYIQPTMAHILIENVVIPDGSFSSSAISLYGTSGAGVTDVTIKGCVIGASTSGSGYALSVNGLNAANLIKVLGCDFSRNSPGSLPILFANSGALYCILDTPGWNAQGFTNDYPAVTNGVYLQSPYPDNRAVYALVPSGTTITNVTVGVWYNGAATRIGQIASGIVGGTNVRAGPFPVQFSGAFYCAWTGATAPTFIWQGL